MIKDWENNQSPTKRIAELNTDGTQSDSGTVLCTLGHLFRTDHHRSGYSMDKRWCILYTSYVKTLQVETT